MNYQISIIIPVYNVRNYLEQCIASVLAQSIDNYELILVDDGSTDGSGEMCDNYAASHSNIVVLHQKNSGQAAARNNAIKIAKGEFLGFVDSDDWIEPNMFKLMLEAAYLYSADMVLCRLQKVLDNGVVTEIVGYDKEFLMTKIDATMEILKDKDMPSFPVNKIYKKKLFDGVEYPLDRFFEDTATTYKTVYKAEKVVAIPYIGYNYRFNPDSTCNNQNIEYGKQVKREMDNAFAFGERYMFSMADDNLTDVVPVCAYKAYSRIRSFIHLQVHKEILLTDLQSKHLYEIMSSFRFKDLVNVPLYHKLDLVLYCISKHTLYLYLKLISFFHPMSRDL